MKKIINSIMVTLFGYIPFKDAYDYPENKIEFRGFIHREVDSISEDTHRFKIY